MVQFVSFYSIAMGAALILTRLAQYLTGQLQLECTTLQQAFSLGGEALTGLCLILAGVGAMIHQRWAPPVQLVALGMLLFCAVFNSGVLSLNEDRADSIFFAASALATLFLAILSVRKTAKPVDPQSAEPLHPPAKPDLMNKVNRL